MIIENIIKSICEMRFILLLIAEKQRETIYY